MNEYLNDYSSDLKKYINDNVEKIKNNKLNDFEIKSILEKVWKEILTVRKYEIYFIQQLNFMYNDKDRLLGIIKNFITLNINDIPLLNVLKSNNLSLKSVVKWYKINKCNEVLIHVFLLQSLYNLPSNLKNNVFIHIVSIAEKEGYYIIGILMLDEKLEFTRYRNDNIIVATLFRLCRKINDYSLVNKLILIYPDIINKKNFNLQYELVYYYDVINDAKRLKQTLDVVKELSKNKLPIAKTLYNFYLKFDMMDEANEIKKHIDNFSLEGEKIKWNQETIDALQEIVDELIRQRGNTIHLLAMNNLLRGFSHELGQPVTAIRYSIQVYQMMHKQKNEENKEIFSLLEKIIAQTDRINRLLARFNPIVSSKSNKTSFRIIERIRAFVTDMELRLVNAHGHIAVIISGDENLGLYGDPVQFDQIIGNLIVNSLDAMINIANGIIKINVRKHKNNVFITFEDNGVGIKEGDQNRIFEPFFSSKISIEGSGSGLGLFLVQNILRFYNGSIYLDKKCNKGAKFIIMIPDKQEVHYESGISS